jgi:hypothetical protein
MSDPVYSGPTIRRAPPWQTVTPQQPTVAVVQGLAPGQSVPAQQVSGGTFTGAFTFASPPTMSGANIAAGSIATSATDLGMFNPMDPVFGAVGNGTTDDTAAVAAAIAAAEAAPYGVVYFPPQKIFLISSTLVISSAISLFSYDAGSGGGGARLRAAATLNAPLIQIKTNATISGLSLYGAGVSANTLADGIYVGTLPAGSGGPSPNNVTVRNCFVTAFYNNVHIDGVTFNGRLEGCFLYNAVYSNLRSTGNPGTDAAGWVWDIVDIVSIYDGTSSYVQQYDALLENMGGINVVNWGSGYNTHARPYGFVCRSLASQGYWNSFVTCYWETTGSAGTGPAFQVGDAAHGFTAVFTYLQFTNCYFGGGPSGTAAFQAYSIQYATFSQCLFSSLGDGIQIVNNAYEIVVSGGCDFQIPSPSVPIHILTGATFDRLFVRDPIYNSSVYFFRVESGVTMGRWEINGGDVGLSAVAVSVVPTAVPGVTQKICAPSYRKGVQATLTNGGSGVGSVITPSNGYWEDFFIFVSGGAGVTQLWVGTPGNYTQLYTQASGAVPGFGFYCPAGQQVYTVFSTTPPNLVCIGV